MEPFLKKKNKQPSKLTSTRQKSSKTGLHFWKVYSFFKSNIIVASLLTVLCLSFVLKYYEDVHDSYSNFKKMDMNIYDVLEVNRDSKDAEIKAKYRELSLKWHPDKNKDCADCEKRFREIKEAYKIILNPYLRQVYDKTNGYTVDMIPSKTVNLSLLNYHMLKDGVWVVQFYSDDSDKCKSFSALWDEFSTKFQKFANFGRVNVLLEEKLLKKLNFKPRLYPTVVMFYNKKRVMFPTDVLPSLNGLGNYFRLNYPHHVKVLTNLADFKNDASKHKLLLYNTVKGNSDPENKQNVRVPLNLKYFSFKFGNLLTFHYAPQHSDELTRELLEEVNNKKVKKLLSDRSKTLNEDVKDDKENKLFGFYYEDNNLKRVLNESLNHLNKLEKLLYTLFTLNVYKVDNNLSLNALCNKYNIKERLCVFLPEKYNLPFDLNDVYGDKYEVYNELQSNTDSSPGEVEETVLVEDEEETKGEGESKEGEKESEKVEQLLSNVRDVQFVKSNANFSFLGRSVDGVVVVNKAKNLVAVLSHLDQEMLHKLLNNELELNWLTLPNVSFFNTSAKNNLYQKLKSYHFFNFSLKNLH